MTAVFADTGFYVAILNSRDALAPATARIAAESAVRVVTTECILLEVASFFCRPAGRPAFIKLVSDLRADSSTSVIPASADLFDRGLALFAARPDKGWSLTDCISLVVMTDHGLTDALTADHHYEQAGFRALLT
jgi:uncharacterized protein